MKLTRTPAALATVALAAGALTAALGPVPAGAEPADRTIRAAGPSVVHVPAYGGTDANVHVVTTGSGTTVVTLHVAGLPEAVRGATLGAHVHTGACGPAPLASGPHYADPAAPAGTPLHDREIWLDSRVNGAGRASAVTVSDWLIPAGAARSVVVHALPTAANGAAGARLLCIDVPFGATS